MDKLKQMMKMDKLKIELLDVHGLYLGCMYNNGDIVDISKSSDGAWFNVENGDCILSPCEHWDEENISWKRITEKTTTTYRVKWEIDIDASSPEEAVKKALEIQRDKKSIATVFEVTEQPKIVDMGT